MWKRYKQKTSCKIKATMLIILVQEDSVSGSYVYGVRRDVLSTKEKIGS